jgi:hypothetical protein
MRLFVSFRAQRSGVEKSVLSGFLHFGPRCGPTVEMTKAQTLITIGLRIVFCLVHCVSCIVPLPFPALHTPVISMSTAGDYNFFTTQITTFGASAI